jgi:hypothetical protein
MYSEVVNQYGRYLGHVTKNIGGIYTSPKMVEEQGAVVEHVPAEIQKEALLFLDKQLFNTPLWLMNKEMTEKTGIDPTIAISSTQRIMLGRIISKFTFDKLVQNETLNGKNAFTVTMLMNELKRSVWKELYSGSNIDVYRRNLQRHYVNSLIAVLGSGVTLSNNGQFAQTSSEATAIARYELSTLESEITRAITQASGLTKAHLMDMVAVIDDALKVEK